MGLGGIVPQDSVIAALSLKLMSRRDLLFLLT